MFIKKKSNVFIIYILFLLILFSCKEIQDKKTGSEGENNVEIKNIPFTSSFLKPIYFRGGEKQKVLALRKTEDIDTVLLPYLGYTEEYFKNHPNMTFDFVKETHPSIKELLAIDYQNDMIIVVFRGTVPSLRYSIKINKLEEYPDRIDIIVSLPAKKGAAGAMEYNPYYVIKVPRSELTRWEGKEIPFVIKDTEGNILPDSFYDQQKPVVIPKKEEVPQASLDLIKQKAAEKSGASATEIEIANSAVVNFEFLNKKIYTAKVMNIKTYDSFGVSIDTDGNLVDEEELSRQDMLLRQQKYGKLNPALYDSLQKMSDDETATVAIYLKDGSDSLLEYLKQKEYEILYVDESEISVNLPKSEIMIISTREDVNSVDITS